MTRKPLRRLVGIDPSLTATGLVVVELTPTTQTVVWRRTVRSHTGEDLLARLSQLATTVSHAVVGATEAFPCADVVIEDPTDQKLIGRNRNVGSICKLGAAVGAIMVSVARDIHLPMHAVPASHWLPKTQTGNFRHAVKHDVAKLLLRHQIVGLDEATDDEVFAAGVAVWWAHHSKEEDL
jgi:Holliday junction resolvasome RuvABC endonuclease subunit